MAEELVIPLLQTDRASYFGALKKKKAAVKAEKKVSGDTDELQPTANTLDEQAEHALLQGKIKPPRNFILLFILFFIKKIASTRVSSSSL